MSCTTIRKKNGNSFYPQVAGHQPADCRNRLVSPHITAVAMSGVRKPEKCLLNTTLNFSEQKIMEVLVYVLHLIWIYPARTTLKRVQNLNVLYYKEKMRLPKFTPSRLVYTMVGNYQLVIVDGNVSVTTRQCRKGVKSCYTSNQPMYTVLLKLLQYYKTPTATCFEPYCPITRQHAAAIYNFVLPDDGKITPEINSSWYFLNIIAVLITLCA